MHLYDAFIMFCKPLYSSKSLKKMMLNLMQFILLVDYYSSFPSSSFILSLHLSFPYIFISPVPSTLLSLFIFPFIFLYFCLFIFTSSYCKFVILSSILCIVFPHKKLSLSLSLSLSHTHTIFFGVFFFIFPTSLL